MKTSKKTSFTFKSKVYFISFLLTCGILLNAYSNLIKKDSFSSFMAPEATISVSKAEVCVDESVTITFKGSGGTAPYTFTYSINGGATQTEISSIGGNDERTITFSKSEIKAFTYTLTNVKDSAGESIAITDQEITINVNAPPVSDFTFSNNNACSGEAVQFTNNSTGEETLTYSWDFGDGKTATSKDPSHAFEALGCGTSEFDVKLTVTDKNGCISSVKTRKITVKEKLDIAFSDTAFGGFNNCGNASLSDPSYAIEVANNSNSDGCVSSYSIDWGDGEVTASPVFPIAHTYASIGVFALKIKAIGTNGCENEVSYQVKNVSNPAGGFASPGNTSDLCVPTEDLEFGITDWGLNSSDTKYTVNFGDGTEETFTQLELEASTYYNSSDPASSEKFPTPHSYKRGSCNEINGGFTAVLTISNACKSTPITISGISTLEPSEADFDVVDVSCVNTNIIFNNKSSIGENPGCAKSANFKWDFGDGEVVNTNSVTAVQNQSHTYDTAGTYTVTLTVTSRCGADVFTKEICIEEEIASSFTVDQNSGCIPLTVKTTNKTDESNLCSAPTYDWIVDYTSDNCGTTADWDFINGTDESSENPEFSFKTAGKYTLTQRAVTGCGTKIFTTVIDVKKPPTVALEDIADGCGNVSFIPIATVENCTSNTSGVTYKWTFTGGTPASSTTLDPGEIVYSTPGVYEVSLEVISECGASNKKTKSFEVLENPTITNTDLSQEICSNQNTAEISLKSINNSVVYSWSAVASSANVTGYTSNGTTNTIPVQTLINNGNTVETVKYTVIPELGTCVGDPVEFIITVNPAPIITEQPISSEVCLNGIPSELSVTYQNGQGTVGYQWFSNTVDNNNNGTRIDGATNTTYQPSADVIGTTYYYVEISFSSGGCSKISSTIASVIVNEQLVIDSVVTNQIICLGGAVNEMKVSSTGGAGDISYQWFLNTSNSDSGGTIIDGATSDTYQPRIFSSPGILYYYVEITPNGNGCSTVVSNVYQIEVLSDPVIDAQPIASQELCQGAIPIDLTVEVSGGSSSDKIYQWYESTSDATDGASKIPGATSATYTPPASSVGSLYYYVVVSQAESGCSVESDVSLVKVNEAPIITEQPISSEVCINGVPSELEVAYENGTGSATYQWFSNTTDDLSSGTKIDGATNATYQPLGDTVGTTYYYVEISFTSGGCSLIKSNTASVVVNEQLVIDSLTANQVLCVGGSANEMEVSYVGGAGNPSYQWFLNTNETSLGGTKISGATNATYTPDVFLSSGVFYYYVEVVLDGNGCSSATSDVIKIEVLSDPVIDTQPIASQELCQGALPTDLTVTVSGGSSSDKIYQWYVNASNATAGGTIIAGATSVNYTPPTSSVGSLYYYVVVSQIESGCSVASNVSLVKINEAPIITEQPASSEICINEVPSELKVAYENGTGVATYQWFSNTVDDVSSGTKIDGATSATYQPFGNTVGTIYYYAEISFSSGGCSLIKSNTASVVVNEIPVISNAEITIYSEDTFNFNPSSIASNVVPVGTKYTWSQPNFSPVGSIIGTSAETTPQDQISQTLENTGTTPVKVTYTITPSTLKCSGNSFTLVVTVNPNITANAIASNISCFEANDATITTNIVGGVPFENGAPYLISWSGPNGFSSTQANIDNLKAGLYTLIIEDKSGFSITETITITQPDILSITKNVEQNVSCFQGNDGTIEVTVVGGTLPYTYNWTTTDGSGIVLNAENQYTLTAGTYALEVIDNNNCTISTDFVLSEPEGLKIEAVFIEDILCFGDAAGAVEISVSGGTPIEISPGVFDYLYSWSGPNGFTSSAKNISNVIAGTYSVAITDGLGCTSNADFVINQSTEIEINYTKTDVTCYGDTNGAIDVEVVGGKAPYTISWSNLANGFSLSNLSADTYIATVTDSNNCVKQVPIIIEQPIFFIDPEVKPISCNGENDGSIDLNLTGGVAPFSVTWNDDATAGVQRNNLSAGTYTVVILDSDANQCPIEQTFVFTNPPAMAVTSTVVDAIDCDIENSGSINLEVSGGTAPYSFLWNTNEITKDLENIPQGDYSVIITDVNGCSVTRQFNIFRQEPLSISLEETTLTDCDLKIVSKQNKAIVTGGYLPYTYTWSDGDVSSTDDAIMTASQNGAYILTITDAKGCEKSTSFLVDVPTIGNTDFRYDAFALDTYDLLSINDPIQFTNLSTGNYTNLTWNFGDGSQSIKEENPVYTYDQVGTFKVTLTVEFTAGCTEVFERTITITQGYLLIHPTAFTPNGDGYNEVIRPVHKGFTELKMTIYDTWGTVVYFEEGLDLKGWNGFIDNKPAENGNYVMVVKGLTFYQKEIVKTSPVTLIK